MVLRKPLLHCVSVVPLTPAGFPSACVLKLLADQLAFVEEPSGPALALASLLLNVLLAS